MPDNPPTQLRKSPRQARSRETVEVLLEAATRVLVEAGFEGASTNRIARVAGVSVGSLYQYFPNKAAIVRMLIERHVTRGIAAGQEWVALHLRMLGRAGRRGP